MLPGARQKEAQSPEPPIRRLFGSVALWGWTELIYDVLMAEQQSGAHRSEHAYSLRVEFAFLLEPVHAITLIQRLRAAQPLAGAANGSGEAWETTPFLI